MCIEGKAGSLDGMHRVLSMSLAPRTVVDNWPSIPYKISVKPSFQVQTHRPQKFEDHCSEVMSPMGLQTLRLPIGERQDFPCLKTARGGSPTLPECLQRLYRGFTEVARSPFS